MNNKTEPKTRTVERYIGDTVFQFEGTRYPGQDWLDTEVVVNGITLCWITWADIDTLFGKIEAAVNQHSI